VNLQVTGNFVHIDERTLYWLAGLLEGEGSFLKGPPSEPHQPRITLTMTDEDVICKVSKLWEVKYHWVNRKRSAEKGWMPAFIVSLKGSRAVSLMQKLHPLMGARRQNQIDLAIASYNIKPHPTTRLNEILVREIKLQLKEQVSIKQLASKYSVNASTIYQIKWGTSWKWVE